VHTRRNVEVMKTQHNFLFLLSASCDVEVLVVVTNESQRRHLYLAYI